MIKSSTSLPGEPDQEMPATSFAPVVSRATHTLILGSMPGRVSLQYHQYYAHPRNGFWHIMGDLYGAGLDLPYPRRLEILLGHGLGLWDVIGSCRRSTSLDSDIEETSIVVNDFQELLTRFPGITRLLFNGRKAQQSFQRYVQPTIATLLPHREMVCLTSTSPANARYSLAEKTRMWRLHLTAPT